jgi:hypothetical protein
MESQPSTKSQKMNLPRFLLALCIKPKQAFTQLDQTLRPHFMWPAIAMLVVIWLGAIITLPVTQREAAEGIDTMLQQTGDKLSELQRASLEQSKQFSTNPIFLVASQGITETIVYPILWISAAGVLYLLSLVFGGQVRFGSILSMTVWASVAEILGKVVLVIGTLVSGHTPQPGMSYLVATESVSAVTPVTAALVQILSKITIFEIWYLVLIGVGIVACAKVMRWKGALITILYWLISFIPPVVLAVVGAAVTSSMFG